MAHQDIIIAGFGGQGILSAGRILAYAGMIEGKEITWMPSYGPEMRGGTANCHVIISDSKIGSPIVVKSTAIVVMNSPSFEKFEPTLAAGGVLVADSTLVDIRTGRSDIKAFYIPATEYAGTIGKSAYACIMLLGKLVSETGIVSSDSFKKALEQVLPPKYHHLVPEEMEVFEKGASF